MDWVALEVEDAVGLPVGGFGEVIESVLGEDWARKEILLLMSLPGHLLALQFSSSSVMQSPTSESPCQRSPWTKCPSVHVQS